MDAERSLKRLFNRIVERFGAEVVDYLRGASPMLGSLTELERELARRFARTLTKLALEILYAESARAIRHADRFITARLAVDESRLLVDPLRQYLAAHVASVWTALASQIAQAVVQRVNDGLAQGETIDQMMQAVGQLVGGGMMEYRLERIVRTETTRAYNAAMLYETAPYDEIVAYRYTVVLDDRTSEVCRPLANKVVRKESLQYMPPLHPNCRTILVPLLRENLPADLNAYTQQSDYTEVARRFGVVPDFLRERLVGNASASVDFWDVWRQHERKLYQFCLDATHGHEDDAKDLLSDTMLRCYSRYHMYDPTRSEFTTWAYRIIKHLNAERVARSSRYEPLT